MITPEFKTMDPSEILEALKGHQDILTPLVRAQHEAFATKTCPSCGGRLEPVLARQPFSPASPLPRYVGRCLSCRAEDIPTSA